MDDRTPAAPAAAPPRAAVRDLVAVALAVAVFAGGWGYWLGVRDAAAVVPDADSVDVGFLRDMVAHHEQALTLSNLLLTAGGSPDVAHFAREILLFQANEIGSMTRLLSVWGHDTEAADDRAMAWMGQAVRVDDMPGLATDEEVAALHGATGAAADAIFVRLMQDHHRGGVHMARAAAGRAASASVRTMAAAMARNQAVEINEMEQTHRRLGLETAPPGYEPDAFPPAGDGQGDHPH